MSDIVISEFMDESALSAIPDSLTLLYDPSLVEARGRLLAALADARALVVRNRTQVDAALLKAAPRLRVVGRLGVGLDNIDLAGCEARGVAVHAAVGANATAVAEYVIAVSLTLVRQSAFSATTALLAGQWPREKLIGGELAGRCLGLVGFGSIARAVAERAQALGLSVLAHDPHLPAGDSAWGEAKRASFPDLLAAADIVSLHVPLTPETRHLIDAAAIGRMKPGAIVINTARGGVVDEAALAGALRGGRLGGAALDVFESEPLSAAAMADFASLPNLILTPHIAGVTQEANIRVSRMTVDAILRELGIGNG